MPSTTHLSHTPHYAKLLRVDEALQHHTDGHIDVILQHVVPQVHAGVCLRHADHGLDVSHGNRNTACSLIANRYKVTNTNYTTNFGGIRTSKFLTMDSFRRSL